VLAELLAQEPPLRLLTPDDTDPSGTRPADMSDPTRGEK
jgi:hypothetical protein